VYLPYLNTTQISVKLVFEGFFGKLLFRITIETENSTCPVVRGIINSPDLGVDFFRPDYNVILEENFTSNAEVLILLKLLTPTVLDRKEVFFILGVNCVLHNNIIHYSNGVDW